MLIRLGCLITIVAVSYAVWAWSAINLYQVHEFIYNISEPVDLRIHHCDVVFKTGGTNKVSINLFLYSSGSPDQLLEQQLESMMPFQNRSDAQEGTEDGTSRLQSFSAFNPLGCFTGNGISDLFTTKTFGCSEQCLVEVQQDVGTGINGTFRILRHVNSVDNDLTSVAISASEMAFSNLLIDLPSAIIELTDVAISNFLQINVVTGSIHLHETTFSVDGSSEIREAPHVTTDAAEVQFTTETDWILPMHQSFLWTQRGSVSLYTNDKWALPSTLDVRSSVNEVCFRVAGARVSMSNETHPWAEDNPGCQIFYGNDSNSTTFGGRLTTAMYDSDHDGYVGQLEFLQGLEDHLHKCCGNRCPAVSACQSSVMPAVFMADRAAGELQSTMQTDAFLEQLLKLNNPSLLPGCMTRIGLVDRGALDERAPVSVRTKDGYVRIEIVDIDDGNHATNRSNISIYKANGSLPGVRLLGLFADEIKDMYSDSDTVFVVIDVEAKPGITEFQRRFFYTPNEFYLGILPHMLLAFSFGMLMPTIKKIGVSFGTGECANAATLDHQGHYIYPDANQTIKSLWRGLRDAFDAADPSGSMKGQIVYLDTDGPISDGAKLRGFHEIAGIITEIPNYRPAQQTAIDLLIVMSLVLGVLLGTTIFIFCFLLGPEKLRMLQEQQTLRSKLRAAKHRQARKIRFSDALALFRSISATANSATSTPAKGQIQTAIADGKRDIAGCCTTPRPSESATESTLKVESQADVPDTSKRALVSMIATEEQPKWREEDAAPDLAMEIVGDLFDRMSKIALAPIRRHFTNSIEYFLKNHIRPLRPTESARYTVTLKDFMIIYLRKCVEYDLVPEENPTELRKTLESKNITFSQREFAALTGIRWKIDSEGIFVPREDIAPRTNQETYSTATLCRLNEAKQWGKITQFVRGPTGIFIHNTAGRLFWVSNDCKTVRHNFIWSDLVKRCWAAIESTGSSSQLVKAEERDTRRLWQYIRLMCPSKYGVWVCLDFGNGDGALLLVAETGEILHRECTGPPEGWQSLTLLCEGEMTSHVGRNLDPLHQSFEPEPESVHKDSRDPNWLAPLWVCTQWRIPGPEDRGRLYKLEFIEDSASCNVWITTRNHNFEQVFARCHYGVNYVPRRSSNLRGPPYVSRLIPTSDGGVWLIRKIPKVELVGVAMDKFRGSMGNSRDENITYQFVRIDTEMQLIQDDRPRDGWGKVMHVVPSSGGDQLYIHTIVFDPEVDRPVSKICKLLSPKRGIRKIGRETINGWQEGQMVQFGVQKRSVNPESSEESANACLPVPEHPRYICTVNIAHTTWCALPGLVTTLCVASDDSVWATLRGERSSSLIKYSHWDLQHYDEEETKLEHGNKRPLSSETVSIAAAQQFCQRLLEPLLNQTIEGIDDMNVFVSELISRMAQKTIANESLAFYVKSFNANTWQSSQAHCEARTKLQTIAIETLKDGLITFKGLKSRSTCRARMSSMIARQLLLGMNRPNWADAIQLVPACGNGTVWVLTERKSGNGLSRASGCLYKVQTHEPTTWPTCNDHVKSKPRSWSVITEKIPTEFPHCFDAFSANASPISIEVTCVESCGDERNGCFAVVPNKTPAVVLSTCGGSPAVHCKEGYVTALPTVPPVANGKWYYEVSIENLKSCTSDQFCCVGWKKVTSRTMARFEDKRSKVDWELQLWNIKEGKKNTKATDKYLLRAADARNLCTGCYEESGKCKRVATLGVPEMIGGEGADPVEPLVVSHCHACFSRTKFAKRSAPLSKDWGNKKARKPLQSDGLSYYMKSNRIELDSNCELDTFNGLIKTRKEGASQ
eukprot:SAG31_NODE_25_length_33055_cov_11.407919_21_plen_1811_part_00